ncbi:MAG: UbiA family prenyltransferase [Methanobrevibacter sp.]|jgi:geranylgeranylglycerol-phosphate geranylgeranyltransferase|nr:UbiA family prenyltransferase [Candidatus Methanoflexus mossambicus]
MKEYIEILRPGNAIMAVIAVILIAIISKTFNINFLLGIITVFLATGGGNAINDVYDYKIDLINKPNRPIPSGKIKLKTAKIYAILLFLIAIILGLIISINLKTFLPLIIVIFNSILMYYYAHTLKSTILIGNLTVAYLTGSCFIFGGTITNNSQIIYLSLILGLFAFLMTLAREIIKDMEDKDGDKKEGVITLPIAHGLRISAILSAIFIIIDLILSPTLYIFNIFNVYYLIPLTIALIIFIISAIKILKNQNKNTSAKVSKLLKIGMFIAFISFAIGSI